MQESKKNTFRKILNQKVYRHISKKTKSADLFFLHFFIFSFFHGVEKIRFGGFRGYPQIFEKMRFFKND